MFGGCLIDNIVDDIVSVGHQHVSRLSLGDEFAEANAEIVCVCRTQVRISDDGIKRIGDVGHGLQLHHLGLSGASVVIDAQVRTFIEAVAQLRGGRIINHIARHGIERAVADEGFGTGVRRIDVEPDRDVIFFSYGFEGEADTLLDGIIAGAFAVGRVELGIVSAAVVDICVFKQFAFVLPDPVRSLYEIVVSDGFYPRDEGAIVVSVVVIPYTLVDNTGRVGEKQISGGGMILSVSV